MPGPQIGTSRLADLVPEQVQPVLLVASFSFCDREQNVAFLAGASLRQMPIHRGFGAFIGQVLAPAAQLSCGTHPGKGSSNSTYDT